VSGTTLLPPRLALRAALRYYRRQPVQLLFTVLGLALGVAVVIAMDLATGSAGRAVEASARLLAGDLTHQVLPAQRSLDESLYPRLRQELGITGALPVVEGRVALAGERPARLTLIGTDALALFARRGDRRPPATGVQGALAGLLGEPGAVLASAAAAAQLGLAPGDRLPLAWPREGYMLRVISVLPEGDAGGSWLLADIATAQEALGLAGQLSRIDLRLDADQAAALAALPAGDWRLAPLEQTVAGFDSLTRSFRLNLQALSLLALLLGAFLVYSTMVVAVLGRRELFAVLRSLGVTRGQVLVLVLVEVLLLAGIAVLLGVVAGSLLGAGLVSLVLQTLDDLYFSLTVDDYRVTTAGLLKGALLGVGASLAAALLPALEAVSGPPRSLAGRAGLERRAARLARLCAGLAAVAALLGALLLFSTDRLAVALAGMFLVLGTAALAVPALAWWSFGALGGWFAARGHAPLAWAARSVSARLSRTGTALAALVLAVASFVGIGLMIAGLRDSVAGWLDYSLDADVYLALDGGLPAGMDPEALADGLRALPGAAGISRSRRVALPDGQGFARLLAVDADPGLGRWPQLRGDPSALARWHGGPDLVLVSEGYAQRQGLVAGDRITLQTPAGDRAFAVAGIIVDYSTEAGVVALPLDRYRETWGDGALSSIGVFARPGQRALLLEAAGDYAAEWPPLRAGDAALLREWSLAIFDRTFTVTRVLQLIAGLVAFLALLNALRALQLDAGRELAVLQALGMDRSALTRLGRSQHLMVGGFAALLALPLGLLLAALLTGVVTRIAFGWSTSFVVDLRLLGEAVLIALAAALLAGWRVPLPAAPRALVAE
jgi:putative ABC transport system permease protein